MSGFGECQTVTASTSDGISQFCNYMTTDTNVMVSNIRSSSDKKITIYDQGTDLNRTGGGGGWRLLFQIRIAPVVVPLVEHNGQRSHMVKWRQFERA